MLPACYTILGQSGGGGGRQIKTPQWHWTGTKCMQYLQCFQVQRYFFCMFKLNNAVYLLGVLTLYIFISLNEL
jgi:hypothetical protein